MHGNLFIRLLKCTWRVWLRDEYDFNYDKVKFIAEEIGTLKL